MNFERVAFAISIGSLSKVREIEIERERDAHRRLFRVMDCACQAHWPPASRPAERQRLAQRQGALCTGGETGKMAAPY